MTVNISLSYEEYVEINTFLKKVNGGLIQNVSALDGFFAAINCTPEVVMPSEFLSVIQEGKKSGDDLVFEDAYEASYFFELVVRHYNEVSNAVEAIGKGKSHLYKPLLTLRDDGLYSPEDWAKGFLQGTYLRSDWWEQHRQYKSPGNPLLPIILLAFCESDEKIIGRKITNEERESLLLSAVDSIKELYLKSRDSRRYNRLFENVAHTNIKLGRNQPCFCGSGKKFKKCCMI